MEQQFITAARRASCFMHAASFRVFINKAGLSGLFHRRPFVSLCVRVCFCD